MLDRLSSAHPGGRVVACSHGDVIPVLLALLADAYSVPRPPLVEHSGWYTLQFTADGLSVTGNSADGS